MPLYFAYGINMDRAGMAQRCPASRPLTPGRLMNHRFFISTSGYATVRRDVGAVVHGLLWDLALADVRALDRFENVSGGLYTKVLQPIVKPGGAHRALVYIGRGGERGQPKAGYMESVVAAASACDLPVDYLKQLQQWLPLQARTHPSRRIRPHLTISPDR